MKQITNEQKSLRRYFREIMIELFNYGTPVYYSVQVSSAKTVLQEIHDYYLSNKGTIYLKQDHIKKLISEFVYLSKSDIAFSRYEKIFVSFNNFLKDSFIGKESQEKEFEKNVELLKIKIEPIIQLLNKTYFDNVCSEIKVLFSKDEVKPVDFKKIKKACFCLSTEILRKGYSRNFIFSNIHNNFPEDKIYEKDIIPFFNTFLNCFNEAINSYPVYLKIIANNEEILGLFKDKYGVADIGFIKPRGNNMSVKSDQKIVSFLAKPNKEYCIFISKNINAKDPEGAVIVFTKEIYDFLDVINYEYPHYNCCIFESAYCSGMKKTVPVLDGYLQKSSITFFNRKKTQIEKIMNSDYIDESSKQKIKTLLKFYRYSCDSNIPEHKLLNLWIGWEHIFSLNMFRNGHTWDNIYRFFPKIHSIGYIEKVFLDIIHAQFKRNNLSTVELDRLISSDNKFKVSNLYSILKNGGEKWNELISLKFLDNDDLTKVKLHRLKEKTKHPKDFIKEHEAKIEWELFRIYRTRNTIVHKGNIEELGLPIEVLTFRLEQFYKSLLEIILENLSYSNRYKNIEQLFISLESTYDLLVSKQNHLSTITDPVEIGRRIIKPIILY